MTLPSFARASRPGDPVAEMSGVRRRGRGRTALAVGAMVAGAAFLAYSATRRDGRAARHAGYPPLDTPKPVAPHIWVVDGEPLMRAGVPVPVRMTVIRLARGDLLLHSPVRHGPALGDRIDELGRVRHLLAPNSAHWMFVEEWRRAYPDAVTWAAPGLDERAQVRRAGVRFDRELDEAAPDAWAEEVEQGIVPGALGFREVYLFHRASRTLVLTDLIENMEPPKLPPLVRPLVRAAGAADGKPALHLRAALVAGGAAAAEAVRRMVALAPERVIFAHGRWFERDGAARLARAFAWLVRGRSTAT